MRDSQNAPYNPIRSSHLAYFERESGAMTNVFFSGTSKPSKRPRSRIVKERFIVLRHNETRLTAKAISKRSENGTPAYRPYITRTYMRPAARALFRFRLFFLIPLSGKFYIFYVKRFRRDRLTALVGKVW